MFRISERNNIFNKISNLKITKERAQNFINNANTTIKDKAYINKTKQENLSKIEEIDKQILELEERISMLDNGDLDIELKETEDKGKNDSKKNKIISINKAVIDQKIKNEKIKKINDMFKMERKMKYTEKQKQRDMKYALERYNSVQLPDYMIENLKNMPSNKGYIWNGIYFFGELQEVKGPLVMFEKQGENRYIHEIYPSEHLIYQKIGDKPKQLIERKIKKAIETPIFSFVDI